MRTLVAGFGNVLRGDDGFGVEVVRRLQQRPSIPGVDVMEIGIAGIRLAQELLGRYDRLIVVDAMARGGAPGTLYVERVESVEAAAEVDMHLAVPARALAVAQALGALPAETFIVGCEPAEVDELTTELTPPVAAAVDAALDHVNRLLTGTAGRTATERSSAGTAVATVRRSTTTSTTVPPAERGRSSAGEAERTADLVEALRQRDEILQVMFWLQAEGLGAEVAPADILRFVDDEPAVRAALAELVESGHLDAVSSARGDARYRLTPVGVQEGRRRFLDEFEPYLARHGHGECGAADCDCRHGGECRELA